MNSARILTAASLALVATVAASTLSIAATGGHGRAAYHGGAGRLDLRDGGRFRIRAVEDRLGFVHPGDWRRHRAYAGGYPYWGGGFYGGDEGYGADGYGPAGFGPEGPPDMGYPPFARPMAPALAPLAYGTGAHDGGYAYGYNGYAQTPPLAIGYGGPGWYAMAGGRPCGC